VTLFTQFINHPNSPYVRYMNWHRLIEPAETAIAPALAPHAKVVFQKAIYTSLTPEVLQFLQDKQIETAYICGIDTDCCVLQTAVDLFEQNIRPIVLLDHCASNGGPESHEAAIRVLTRSIGAANLIRGQLPIRQPLSQAPG
jgi:nicotinamidase-related amidase